MENRNLKKRLLIFFGFLLVFHILTLNKYPLASVDESWLSSNAYSNFNKDYRSVNYPFFQQNWGVPYSMNFFFGLVYKIFGLGLLQGRLFELFISFLVLLVLYKLCKDVFSETVAFWSVVFFASTRIFLYSSHLIRTDMAFTFLILLSAYIFLKFLKTGSRSYIFLSGFVVSYSSEVHQNGVFFWIATILAWIFVSSWKKIFSKEFVFFLLGTGMYLIYYIPAHFLPNPSLFISQRSYSLLVDHTVPILSFTSLKELISLEINRYASYFFPLRMIELVIVLISSAWAIKQKNIFLRFTAIYVLIPILLFFPFSSHKTEVYLLYFFPFFAILIASFFNKILIDNYRAQLIIHSKNKVNKIFIPMVNIFYLFILIILFNFFVQLKIAYDYSSYNYSKLGFLVKNQISSNSAILGNPLFWLPTGTLNYKSFYVLTWYRVFENKSLTEALKIINPDIIIVDPTFEDLLVEDKNLITDIDFQKGLYKIPKKEFMDYLDKNAVLATEHLDPYHGRIRIFKVK